MRASVAFREGLVRLASPDGRSRRRVEAADADALIEQAWVMLP